MNKTIQEKAIELAKLPYTVELLRDKTTDGGYVYLAKNPELEGCMVQGLTEQEALDNLDEVRIEHIEHLLEHNLPVPIPSHAIANSRQENVVIKDIPTVTLPGFEEFLTRVIKPDARELVYSRTPNT